MTSQMKTTRQSKRGGALLGALFFMVAVTAGGIALLESSTLNQLAVIERSVDVRLMIAAEAGLETVRGRFKLVAGVQDDWRVLAPSTNWTHVDTMTVNGIAVRVETRDMTADSIGKAEVRTIATGPNYERVVQMTLRLPSFSDYAVFLAGSGRRKPATGFMYMGDFYTAGALAIQDRPHFFGQTYVGTTVINGAYNDPVVFPVSPAQENTPVVSMPPSTYGEGKMEDASILTDTKFYKNTYKIELRGNTFRRWYHWKRSTPTPTTGTDYQDIAIPASGVIYVSSHNCPANWSAPSASPADNATGTELIADTKVNNWEWDTSSNGNHPSWYSNPPNVTNNNRVNLDLSGWLAKGVRVTIACEHQIQLVDNIIYETYAENPDLRRRPYRQSQEALEMTEMLGVYAREWIRIESLSNISTIPQSDIDSDGINAGSSTIEVTNGYLTEDPSGASTDSRLNSDVNEQNCLDGVFMSGGYAVRCDRLRSGRERRSLWMCGSFIANGQDRSNNSAPMLYLQYGPKIYNYDYRMKVTTPPYFLIAYNTSAKMLPGTWLTYKR